MAVGAVVARILTQYSDKGSKAAQKDIAKLGKQIDAFGKKAAKSFGIAIAATATLAIKIGKDSVAAAIQDSKSQLILANAMINTTGATKDAILAAEKYIEKTMFRVHVTDEELRSSLATLFIATQDMTEAQRLQQIALDLSAASTKDLQTVTIGITKAQQGNVDSLKKLSPEISGLITKTTKFEDAMFILGGTYQGTAEKLADLDPLKGLSLAYGETLETLGYELLPVIKEFADIIVKDVLPVVKEWTKANGETLREGLKAAVEVILSLTKTLAELARFYAKFDWVIKLAFSFFALGKVFKYVGIALKPLNGIFGGIIKKGSVLKDIGASFRIIGETINKFFTKNSTIMGASSKQLLFFGKLAKAVGKAAFAFLGLGTAWIVAKNGLKQLFGLDVTFPWENEAKKQKKYVANVKENSARAATAAKASADAQVALAKKVAKARAKAAAEAAAQAKVQDYLDAKKVKDDAKKVAIDKKVEEIKRRLGVTPTKITDQDEYELIQLTAVEKLQKKQKEVDTAFIERINLRKEELALFRSLTEKTQQYLEFLKAINSDGKLDDSELAKLMSKWGLTKQEAEKYASFIYAIGDRRLSDDEIDKLKKQWGLTTAQVVAYIEKIGSPVDATATSLTAGAIAALGWKDATAALDTYNAKLKGAIVTAPPPPTINPTTPPASTTPSASQDEYATSLGRYFAGLDPAPTKPLAPFERSLGGYGGPSYAGINFNSSTLDNGMSLMSDQFSNSNGSQSNIYLTVNGSVTSEQDLVQTIRQGLLQGQSSGYGLLLQEI